MKIWIRRNLLPFVIASIIKMLGMTVRIRLSDPHQVGEWRRGKNFIMAYWHNRIGLLAYAYEKLLSHQPMFILSSLSNDGQLMADIVACFNLGAIRGSSSRNGSRAFRQLLVELKRNHSSVSITPDGPRGPRYRVQMGSIALAKMSGLPIIPVQWESKRKWIIARSWDRFQIPCPFTRVEIRIGEPIYVPEDADEVLMEECRQRLEKALGGD